MFGLVSLSLSSSLYLYFLFISPSTSFSSCWSLSFFCLHCFKSAYLCCLSTRNTNEYASSPRNNLTPFVCKHIPSLLLLSHSCHWFYFDKKPEEETALFPPSFLLQSRFSLCLIIIPDSWALIKALHLTNNTNDVRSQRQMESFQITGRPVRNTKNKCVLHLYFPHWNITG